MKSLAESPWKNFAVPAVGSTWLGPAVKSPAGSGVHCPRKTAPRRFDIARTMFCAFEHEFDVLRRIVAGNHEGFVDICRFDEEYSMFKNAFHRRISGESLRLFEKFRFHLMDDFRAVGYENSLFKAASVFRLR